MFLSQSANHSLIKNADMARYRKYITSLRRLLTFSKSVPEQDLPETSPRFYAIRDNPSVPDVENEMVNHLVNLMVLCRDEMDNSQSARYSSGIHDSDYLRSNQYMDRMEVFLTEYAEEVMPLDLPESSPRAAITEPGKTGINP
jgi:hypothetical protein